jgi:hypothetical protein
MGRDEEIVYRPGATHFVWKALETPGCNTTERICRGKCWEKGVVLRTTVDSSTVLITFTLRELFAGDFAELD